MTRKVCPCSTFVVGPHTTAEEVVFPFLNRKMDFAKEADEHKAIHTALDGIISHIREVKADTAKFQPAELKRLMEDFHGPLVCQPLAGSYED